MIKTIKVSQKETVWYDTEYYIPDTMTDEEFLKIALSEQFGINDLDQFDRDGEYNLETGEMMNPEENDGQSTIEIWNDKGEIIYQNGK